MFQRHKDPIHTCRLAVAAHYQNSYNASGVNGIINSIVLEAIPISDDELKLLS